MLRRGSGPGLVTGLGVLACLVTGAQDGRATDADLHLSAVTPTYSTPPGDLFDSEEYGRLPVRLLGIDLVQGGAAIEGDVPQVSSNAGLVVRTYWEPTRRLSAQVPMAASVWDYMCLLRHDSEWRVGPKRNDAAWGAGMVYRQEFRLPTDEIASTFSGDSFLSISLLTPREPDWKDRPLMLLPLNLSPRSEESNIPRRLLDRTLDGEYQLIDVRTRLGINASMEIPVPEDARRSATLHLYSDLAYRSPGQGETIGVLTFTDTDGNTSDLPIRSGLETSRGDYDAYAPGELGHDRVRILRSRESGQLDSRGRPLQIHTYAAEIAVPRGLGPLETITLTCVGETFFDLHGLALAK